MPLRHSPFISKKTCIASPLSLSSYQSILRKSLFLQITPYPQTRLGQNPKYNTSSSSTLHSNSIHINRVQLEDHNSTDKRTLRRLHRLA